MKKLPLASLLAVLLLVPPGLRAADATSESAGPTRPGAAALATFEFPGGTIAQLVTLLSKTPVAINIIGDPADMATPIPAFTLQNVQPEVLGNALSQFLESRGLQLSPSYIGGAPANRTIYVVRHLGVKGSRTPDDAFESFQLAPYLENQKVDDIVGAIRAAWELDPGHEPNALRLKYHPPTSILLVSGPGNAIMIAQRIIGTLKRSPSEVPAVYTPKPAPPEKR